VSCNASFVPVDLASLVIRHPSLVPITPFPLARAGKGRTGATRRKTHQPRSPFQAREAQPFPATPCRPPPIDRLQEPVGAVGRRPMYYVGSDTIEERARIGTGRLRADRSPSTKNWHPPKEVDASTPAVCRPFSFPNTGGTAVSDRALSPTPHRPLTRARRGGGSEKGHALFSHAILHPFAPIDKGEPLEIGHISEDLRGLDPHRHKRSRSAYSCRFSEASIVENLGGLATTVSYR